MSTRNFSKVIMGVLTIAAPAFSIAGPPEKQPNILMIVIDNLNDWVGFMDAHPNALTPNMDKLAAKGVVFTNAHAAASQLSTCDEPCMGTQFSHGLQRIF